MTRAAPSPADSTAATGAGTDITDGTARPDTAPISAADARTLQPFTVYAAGGRIYASNVRHKLIDLGSLQPESPDSGTLAYALDGGDHPGAGGFADAAAALQHLGRHIPFLFLDGQFTALPDVREHGGVELDRADARLGITLDAFGTGEAAFDAGV